MEVQRSILEKSQLFKGESGNALSSSLSESFVEGSYLEAWFHCLQLSKEYTQNCRTGFFPSEKSYETFRLFGHVEDRTFLQWWEDWGFDKFRNGLTTVRVRQVVRHKVEGGYGFTIDVYPGTPLDLAGTEFSFVIEQIRKLSNSNGLLSSAPMAWAIYKSRISAESIRLHLDVLQAYENIIRNSPSTKLSSVSQP